MKNGPTRFKFFLDRLTHLLKNSESQKNPALWLYKNEARTTLFMLESLAKLYNGLHDNKMFSKLDLNFKLLEDALGVIDYYDGFVKEFSNDKQIALEIKKFIEKKRDESIQLFNNLLVEKEWIGKDANRLEKIRTKLEDVDWLEDKTEIKEIEKFYKLSIEKIIAFDELYKSGFDNIETEVHEFRRKLRWLSIYPQALRGCIQLTDQSEKNESLSKYLTPEIVNSPFNKLPEAGVNKILLLLNKDYFLALSWLISDLGKLKDKGLRINILQEAGYIAKTDSTEMKKILVDATEVCRRYIKEKNLEHLINGITINA